MFKFFERQRYKKQVTDAAHDWLRDNCDAPDYMWFGSALAIEHRYAADIANAMLAEGFRVG